MNKFILTITVITSFLMMSCNSTLKSPKESFTVKETAEQLKSGALLIDVRNADEVAEQSYDVEEVIHIPLDSIESKLSAIPKDKQVILACRSGKRSQAAFDLLKEKGYLNIANLEGGMNAWAAAGMPTKTGKTEACCEDPSSENCNPDGTCKTPEEKSTAAEAKTVAVTKVSETKSAAAIKQANRLEVYCFHGTRQCETCINMKANTKATLNKYFAADLKSGKITFAIVDVDDSKNEKIAEKFQATGTALMINKVVNGKDNISDWSDFAFDKANDAEVFIPELKTKLETALK